MSRRFLHIIAVCCIVACIFACAGPPAETMVGVDPSGWALSDPTRITVDNRDTAALRTISILMSYNNDFTGEGFPVQIAVTSPDGKYYAERFVMYESNMRKKQSDFHESVMPYRDSVLLSVVGQYAFSISPLHEVEGVRAVGIKIE